MLLLHLAPKSSTPSPRTRRNGKLNYDSAVSETLVGLGNGVAFQPSLDRPFRSRPFSRTCGVYGLTVPQLQTHLVVKVVTWLGILQPIFAPQKDVNAPVAITHPGFYNLFDADIEFNLLVGVHIVVKGRTMCLYHAIGTSNTDVPNNAAVLDQFAAAAAGL